MAVLTADAVVVGGGHHGLVAAALLADAGWDVCLLEATDRRRRRGPIDDAAPGLHHGPVLGVLPAVRRVAGPAGAGPGGARAAAVARTGGARPSATTGRRTGGLLYRDREATAARLAEEHPRDGDAWLELCRQWDTVGERGAAHVLHDVPAGPRSASAAAGRRHGRRAAARPVPPAAGRRMGEELFDGEGARLLLAGNAAHADAPVDAPVSGAYGWLLAMLASTTGSPCRSAGPASSPPRCLGGRSRRRDVALRASRSNGSTCAAAGPRRPHGGRADRAGAPRRDRRRQRPALYRTLLPPRAASAARRPGPLRLGHPVVKVNWALERPIPWRAPETSGPDRAPGRRRARPRPVVGRSGVADAAGFAVPAVRQMTTADARVSTGTRAHGGTRTCRADPRRRLRRRSWPGGPTSSRSRRGLPTECALARPAAARPGDRTHLVSARSTGARRSCSSSSCSARCQGWVGGPWSRTLSHRRVVRASGGGVHGISEARRARRCGPRARRPPAAPAHAALHLLYRD